MAILTAYMDLSVSNSIGLCMLKLNQLRGLSLKTFFLIGASTFGKAFVSWSFSLESVMHDDGSQGKRSRVIEVKLSTDTQPVSVSTQHTNGKN